MVLTPVPVLLCRSLSYEGSLYRPPSEADSFILQATTGCSWNACTYCEMYRDKAFRIRDLDEVLKDIQSAGGNWGPHVKRVFVADGDALVMDMRHWEAILSACHEVFPRLSRISAYATAINLNDKTPDELRRLRDMGLSLLYIGPETGDDVTLKAIAKGAGYAEHVEAARRAKGAGIDLSAIFLLGIGGTERSAEHAAASARLVTEMDPRYLSLLTLTVIPSSPIARLMERGKFELPTVEGFLRELATIVSEARPTNAVFRTNHASNYLPLSGRLPRDRETLLCTLERALTGDIRLRPEWSRGL